MTKQYGPWLAIAATLVTVGVIQGSTLRSGHSWGGDFSMYVHHAKNLVEGTPYGATGYLYNPDYAKIGPPTYPPVCPLLLAPVYLVWGLNFEAMKLVMLGSLLVCLLAVFLSFRKELPTAHCLAIVALVGLNRTFLGGANTIGSDLPFMALLYLTILAFQKAYDVAPGRPPRFALLVPATLLLFVDFATRTLGGVLLPAVLAYDLLRYRRVTRSAVLVGGLFVVLALAQSLLVHSNTAYFDQYNVGPGVFVHNAIAYLGEGAAFWHNGYIKPLAVLLFAAVTALALLGFVARARRKLTLLEIFPVLYLAAVLLFPSFAGRRFLQPIFPLYFFFAFSGLEHAWLVRRAAVRRVVLASLLAAVAGSYAATSTRLDLEVNEGICKAESVALFDFVSRKTPDDAVMIFVKPRVIALLGSRSASAYHTPADDAALWDYFRRIGATHLVVIENDAAFAGAEDPARLTYLRRFARNHADRLRTVFANADFRVCQIADPEVDLATHSADPAHGTARKKGTGLILCRAHGKRQVVLGQNEPRPLFPLFPPEKK